MIVGSLCGQEMLLNFVKKEAVKRGYCKLNDVMIVTTGVHEGIEGATNLLKIIRV